MRLLSLSVPGPFSEGPQYDPDTGKLIPSSWPAGLPHEGIQGWYKLGIPSGGRELIDFVCSDDWPVGDIPGGWLANGDHSWNGVDQDLYDDDGNLIGSGLVTNTPTDYAEYNKHLKDENDKPRTETTRVHGYLGWPVMRD